MLLQEAEYLILRCITCNAQVKLAKNDGSALWKLRWVSACEDFLTEHGGCPCEGITLNID